MPPAAPLAPAARFTRDRNLTLASLIVGYMGYYLCRQNVAVAFPLLGSELGLTKASFGAAMSTGTAVYAVGKVLSGPLIDARGGRGMFFVGLFGSAIATALLGALLAAPGGGVSMIALVGLWGVNRLFQSAGWGGLLSVLSRWYSRRDYGAASGALSISYQLGGAVALAACGLLVPLGWRWLFLGPAAALALLGGGLWFTLAGSPADLGHRLPDDDDPAHARGASRGPDKPAAALGARVLKLLASPPFLIVCALSFVLTLVREAFNTWLPAYFTEMGARASVASVKSTLFPLLGAVGTLLAGWLSDRVWRGQRGPIMALFLVGAGLSLLGLSRPDEVARTAGLSRDAVILALTGASGFFVLAPYSMVGGGVLALDAGGRASAATAAGLLDGVGYLGATLAGIGVAEAVARRGWGASFATLAVAVFGSAVLAAVLWIAVERKRVVR